MPALLRVVLFSVELRVMVAVPGTVTRTEAPSGVGSLVLLTLPVLSLPSMAVPSSWSSRPTLPVPEVLVATAE